MIEIGRTKIIKVRTKDKLTRKLVPKMGSDGQQETRVVADEIWRETKGTLGHNYGSRQHGRKLIAGFVDGDMLVLYPKGTRQEERASLFDIFNWMIRSRVLHVQLEKARNTKKAKDARRRAASIRRAELRLKRPL